jgi:predicted permease
MNEFFRRLRYLLNRRRFDEELQNDMEFHREMAEREGRKNFGNALRLREQAREAWGWTWIDRLIQDLRFAARMLARSPGFTSSAVMVLAIGIGVNVSAFSLFDMVALKPLPVPDPESLVRLERRSPEITSSEMPYPSVVFYRDHAKTLSAVMAVMGVPPMEIENDLEPAHASFATANYFTELGTIPALGRVFDPTRDDAPGAPPVVVLSHEFWLRRFGGDPSIIGSTIHLNARQATVIGITPFAFASLGGQSPDIWLPMSQQPYFIEGSKALVDTTAGTVRMWARLAPGVTAQMAEHELLALTNELRRQRPKDIWDGEYIKSEPGGHLQVMQPEMYRVAAMVALLTLLILAVACANLGGLLLARGVTREHEIGIRVSIGASRARIFRQLLTESLVLATLGSLAGLAIGCVALHIVLLKVDAPKWLTAMPDWRVLSFVSGMTLLATIFFGFAPALQIARQRQRRTLARQVLIGAQVAASCILLIVAALLVRAVHHALYAYPGFGYEQVLSIDPGLGRHGYTAPAAQQYLDQLKTRFRGLPGVTSVSLVKLPPMGHTISRVGTEVAGRPLDIYPNWVDAEFFHTMGIPVLMGRNFLPGEKNAVIVSQSLARAQWPGESPLGKTYWGKDTVVGVVGNARINSLNEDDTVEEYEPVQLADMPDMVVIVKTAGAPDGLIPAAKAIVQNLDPKVFPEIRLLRAAFRVEMKSVELAAVAVSMIGVVAVVLAGVGIIGMVAFTVSQRLKEIAIRLALGAGHGQVFSAVLGQFCWPVVLGLMTGLGFAAGTSKVLRKTLFGVSNLDPASYAAAITTLIAVIAAAALFPARRALRVDLAKTLHYE